MKKIFLLVLLLITINSNAQTSLRDSIYSRLQILKEQTNVKALIAGVWEGDKNILSAAFGESMTSVPADTSMHVRIGGITETFFGTLVMILVDKGVISLDDKISKWLPDLLESDKVTVGMLIRNTSGYKDYVVNRDFVNLITNEPFKHITRKEILEYSVGEGQLNFPPGTKQEYSHTSFTILGEVLEKAAGKDLGELFRESIFDPVGLSHTGWNINAELPYPVLHAFSSDRGIYEDVTFWSPSWTQDSGPMYSTLNDLAKWAPVFGKGKLLSKESFNELIKKPESAANPDKFMAAGFGIVNGWYIQNPSFNGYSGGFGYYPAREITIVTFTTESEDKDSDAKAFTILQEIVKMLTPEAALNLN